MLNITIQQERRMHIIKVCTSSKVSLIPRGHGIVLSITIQQERRMHIIKVCTSSKVSLIPRGHGIVLNIATVFP